MAKRYKHKNKETYQYKQYLSRFASRKGELTYEYNGHTYYTYEYTQVRSNKSKKAKFEARQERRKMKLESGDVEWYDDARLSKIDFQRGLEDEKRLIQRSNLKGSNPINNLVSYQEYGASQRQAMSVRIMLQETGQEDLLEDYSRGLRGVKELIREDRAIREETEGEESIIDYASLREYYHQLIEGGMSSKDAKGQIAQEYFGSP